MVPNLKCDVCKENEAIGVASSWLGAFSVGYCQRCHEAGAEPYWSLIATHSTGRLGTFADFIPDFKDAVMATLEILGKSLDEYWADVEKSIEEEYEFFRSQESEMGHIPEDQIDPFPSLE